MSAVLGLALARLRRHPGRGLLTALGVALAAAALVATLSVRTLAGDVALRQAITDRPPGDRSATVSRSQAVDDLRPLDRVARASLARLHAGATRREMMLRVLSDGHGGTFRLAAIDGADKVVRLTSGRLPGPCRNGRCEVLLVGSKQPQLDPALGIEVVGRGQITDPVLLAGTFDPGPDVPVLLSADVDGLNAHEPTVLFQRSYGWVASLDPDTLRVAGLGTLLRATAAAADSVERSGMVLTAPDDALVAAAARARASSRRLLLVGGQLVAVLAAFVALAALGLRDDHATARTLLARRGASRRQSLVFTAAEAGWPVLAGLVPGVLAGIGVAYAVAGHEDVAGGQLVRDALGGDALVALLVLVAGLWLLLGGILRTSEGPLRRGVRGSDIAAVVLAAVAILAASRGNATAERLGDQDDPLLALLPALVAGAGGLLAMRLVAPSLALLARVAPSRSGLARVGVADALRRPARPLATVAFLVAACALAIFATAYRATLRAGAADQAAFGVPLDARLTTGAEPRPAARRRVARPVPGAGAERHRVHGAAPGGGGADERARHPTRWRCSGSTRPSCRTCTGSAPTRRRPRSPIASAAPPYPVQGAPLPASATRCGSMRPARRTSSISAILARPDGVQGVVPGAGIDPGGVPRRHVRRAPDPRDADAASPPSCTTSARAPRRSRSARSRSTCAPSSPSPAARCPST